MNKISYALGLGIGQQLKNMNIEDFSIEDFTRSIQDIMSGNPTAMSSREAQQMLNDYFKKKEKEQAETAIAEGKVFLEQNARKAGVVQTRSGLQYEVLTEGSGRSPKATDTVRCHYEGRLLDGTVFDSSYKRNKPTTFQVDQVIPGWIEALTLMPVGSKWEIYIPQELAYGEREQSKIPPFSCLIFTVELKEIAKAQ